VDSVSPHLKTHSSVLSTMERKGKEKGDRTEGKGKRETERKGKGK
jgi:hypothetical protein